MAIHLRIISQTNIAVKAMLEAIIASSQPAVWPRCTISMKSILIMITAIMNWSNPGDTMMSYMRSRSRLVGGGYFVCSLVTVIMRWIVIHCCWASVKNGFPPCFSFISLNCKATHQMFKLDKLEIFPAFKAIIYVRKSINMCMPLYNSMHIWQHWHMPMIHWYVYDIGLHPSLCGDSAHGQLQFVSIQYIQKCEPLCVWTWTVHSCGIPVRTLSMETPIIMLSMKKEPNTTKTMK